jgi:hypothetical protein
VLLALRDWDVSIDGGGGMSSAEKAMLVQMSKKLKVVSFNSVILNSLSLFSYKSSNTSASAAEGSKPQLS